MYINWVQFYGMCGSVGYECSRSPIIINPRRACAARVTVLRVSVCLSVCLSVDAYSGTTGYEAAYELYKRVQIYKGLKITRRFS